MSSTAKTLIAIGIGIVWLTGLVLSFAHASETVGVDLQNGLIWFGAALLWGVLGVKFIFPLMRKL